MKKFIIIISILTPVLLFGQGMNKTIYDLDGRLNTTYLVTDNGNYSFTKFHPNGIKASIGKFKNGEKHGVWKTWDLNGTVTSIGRYKNGEKSGKWVIVNDVEQTTFEISFQRNHLMHALKKDEHGHIIAKR